MAPAHFFVKYRLDNDIYRNFEATSGGPKLDSSYRRDIPMTDLAISNGVYMRPLTKKETVVVMAEILLQWYRQKNQPEKIIALSDLLLKYFPNEVAIMIFKGSAYTAMLERDFEKVYRTPSDIPLQEHVRYNELAENNQLWFHKAEELGWRETSSDVNKKYMRIVERAKAAR